MITSPSSPLSEPRMNLTLSFGENWGASKVTGKSLCPSMKRSVAISEAGMTATAFVPAEVVTEGLVINLYMKGWFTICLRWVSEHRMKSFEGITM